MSTAQEQRTDVLIVGAGPIGLETAAAIRREGQSCVNIDAGALGSQIMRFPIGVRFFSSSERIAIAGVPLESTLQEKASREEYMAYLRSVVLQLDLDVRTYETLVGVEGEHGAFLCTTQTSGGVQRRIQAAAIVLAVGGTARSRRLGVPGEDLPHVRREIGEPHLYFQRNVLIVGGKNSAAESALRIWRAHGNVTMSMRRDSIYQGIKYWIRPELESAFNNNQIRGEFSTSVQEILPDRVVLQRDSGETFQVEVDDVLLQIGYEADSTCFQMLGCELDPEQGRVIHVESTMETTVPGVYVAGTAVSGTQVRYKSYIENCHIHALRIAAHLSGKPAPEPMPLPELPEA